MTCQICGKEIPSYSIGDFFPESQCLCYGNHPNMINPISSSIVWNTPPQIKQCEHCYCREIKVNENGIESSYGIKHKKCCMCGNRKLV